MQKIKSVIKRRSVRLIRLRVSDVQTLNRAPRRSKPKRIDLRRAWRVRSPYPERLAGFTEGSESAPQQQATARW